jgi:hypothetical protein
MPRQKMLATPGHDAMEQELEQSPAPAACEAYGPAQARRRHPRSGTRNTPGHPCDHETGIEHDSPFRKIR